MELKISTLLGCLKTKGEDVYRALIPVSATSQMLSRQLAGMNGKPIFKRNWDRDFPGGTVVKNLPANGGDTGSSPGPGRSHMLQSN